MVICQWSMIIDEMKSCHKCSLQKDTLYRVRISENKVWVFVCSECMKIDKPHNPHYQYGRTWKNRKKKKKNKKNLKRMMTPK